MNYSPPTEQASPIKNDWYTVRFSHQSQACSHHCVAFWPQMSSPKLQLNLRKLRKQNPSRIILKQSSPSKVWEREISAAFFGGEGFFSYWVKVRAYVRRFNTGGLQLVQPEGTHDQSPRVQFWTCYPKSIRESLFFRWHTHVYGLFEKEKKKVPASAYTPTLAQSTWT